VQASLGLSASYSRQAHLEHNVINQFISLVSAQRKRTSAFRGPVKTVQGTFTFSKIADIIRTERFLMKILLIWGDDYPWDVRIEKFLRALHSNGHMVHLLCRNLKSLERNETWEYGHIHRLPALKIAFLNYFFSFPVFLNPSG